MPKILRQDLIDTLDTAYRDWVPPQPLDPIVAQVDALVQWLRVNRVYDLVNDEGYRREMTGQSAGNDSDLDLLADLLEASDED